MSEPHLSDLGNSERFIRDHGDEVRYVEKWRKWLAWDGKRWKVGQGAARQLAKETVRNMYAEAQTIEDDIARKQLGRHVVKSEAAKAVRDMLDMAWSEVCVEHETFDADPYLLNVRNGTLDLRTGVLRPHRREDHLSKLAPVAYDPDAECPQWTAFMDRIFAGKADVQWYVQQQCGMFLTGDVSQQILPVWFGTGANGKTTLFERLLDILGDDYSTQAPSDLLLEKQAGHPTEFAMLHGKRLVITSETGKRRHLNEDLVKRLTGGDRITGRRMREDFWQFTPTHKLLLSTNHVPRVEGTDHAIWRRVKLVPFRETIHDHERDPKLADKLRGELPGILNWCIEGCLAWRANGLEEPAEVTKATGDYRHKEDIIGAFIRECVEEDGHCRTRPDELRQAFCQHSGTSMESREFGLRLKQLGYESYRGTGGARFYRVRLKTTNDVR